MAGSEPIIITTCTNRKRYKATKELQARNLPRGTLEQIANNWCHSIERSTVFHKPGNLYCGRGFREALLANENGRNGIYVISAGLGLVRPEQIIPSYELTILKRTLDSIHHRVIDPIEDWEWWKKINQLMKNKNPFERLFKENPDVLVMMAISETYLKMISPELIKIASPELARLRLFGPRGSADVPEELQECIMPYGETFEGPDCPLPGTRADFAQRAMRHFRQVIVNTEEPIREPLNHQQRVRNIAKEWRLPTALDRDKRTDEEIINLVPDLWFRAKGSSARMLRILRDQELIACEQSRFAKLFKIAKERYRLL